MSTLPRDFRHLDFKQLLVTTRPSSKGVVLNITGNHPCIARPLSAEHTRDDAALVLEALFELPPETRAQLYTMLAESSDTFCGVKPRGGRVYEPVKGGTRR